LRQIGIEPWFTPVVAKLSHDSPGEKAGLKVNDEIVEIDGKKLPGPEGILDWAQDHPGKPLPLTIKRGDQLLHISVDPGHPIIARTMHNSPGEAAGLKGGDKIVALNGEPIYDPAAINNFVVHHSDESLVLTIRSSNGAERQVPITPVRPVGQKDPMIGIRFKPETLGISWDGGGIPGIAHTLPTEQLYKAVETVTSTIGALLSPHSDIKLEHMSGPVMIMRTYYMLFQSQYGWQLALWLSVVFNVNLAIVNLLPIPVLDGGHILLALIEWIRRRPINVKVIEVLQAACALLLIGFMLYVSFYDVTDSWGNGNSDPKFMTSSKASP
jgi:regulator of sigma E protease